MDSLNLKQIAEIVNGFLIGNPEVKVCNVLTDSRIVAQTDGSVFFALKTPKNNGHKYIPDLIKRGVKVFVVSERQADTRASYILVDDTLLALQNLARFNRRKLKGKVIAITGSNGKTIVKEWFFQLLSKNFKVYRSPRSYNSQLGVALSLLYADVSCDFHIIEAGISMPGEMERLAVMIEPDIALMTNIGDPHQENFSSLEHKAREKLLLLKNAGIKIVPADCNPLQKILNNDFTGYFAWSFSSSYGVSVSVRTKKHVSQISFKGRINHSVTIPYTDSASVENAIACFYLLKAVGENPKKYTESFASLEPVAMRMELRQGINNSVLINDSYNSDIGSLAIALDFLLQQAGHKKRLKRVILSDIVQSGKNPEELYDEVNKLLVDKGIESLIGVGESISGHAGHFTVPGDFYLTTSDLLQRMDSYSFTNEAILIKGARKYQFETVASRLSKRVHKTTLEINLNHLVHNISHFRSKLGPEVRVMAMVKAFAYGAGAFEVARHLQHHGVDYLAVAVADEGVELRKAGVTIPIMVMAPDLENPETLLLNRLEPVIYSHEVFNALLQKASAMGEMDYPVHLKLDTGMHRMGFMAGEIADLAEAISGQAQLRVVSVFSHLAAADEPDKDAFTHQQLTLFEAMSRQLGVALKQPFMRHILNSAGCERFPSAHYDMVRLGIGMYGVSCIGDTELLPVGTFKTTIVQVKEVPKTDTVGYGRKGVLKRDSRIAIVPVGYADGLSRLVGNGKGYALVKGLKVPYVGNICMDLCMIDVTDTDAEAGDEVCLFGDNPDINQLAQWMQTIPYEVITSISQRVKRVFTSE